MNNIKIYVFVSAVAAAALILRPSNCHAEPKAAAMSAQKAVLASHRALYAVTLTSTRPGADYSDVSGKMVLEFKDKCNVWTTLQKSLLKTISGDGAQDVSTSDFRSSENKAGDVYTFQVRQTQNGDVTEYAGTATRTASDGPGVAEYTAPEHVTYKLPAHFLFQTAQQVKLIEIAQHGGRFLSGEMFDGSEGGGAARFNAVLLKGESKDHGIPLNNPLLDSPAHRVRIAFYPPQAEHDAGGAEAADGEQPEYEMTMTLHDNGVVSDYDYDYEDFSVHGQLQALQSLSRPNC
jgi:hypothetical protein